MPHRLIFISGAPGSGKSTLAKPLAARMGFPLISKDAVKETLVRVLGDDGGDLAASRRLGGAAMEVLWTLAASAPDVILEANFRPRSAYEREKLLSLGGWSLELNCVCGADETARRFAARASTTDHDRSAHPLAALPPELLAEYDQPMNIGQVLRIDTATPVDIETLAARIEALWPA